MLSKSNPTWPQKPLSEVVDLNPRLDKSAYRDDLEVSFVPMAAVEACSGRMEVSQTKHFVAVKKGYTPFKEGDVVFAKITPCMENGKMAVVPKLTNGLGFGSTEFHVLRPHEGIDARFVYYFVSSQGFRREAAHHMTGAVGQKRVPQSFLEEASIPVPLLEDQQRIVAEIEKQFSRLDEAVASLKRTKANLKRYKASVLKAAVEGKLTEDWRKQHPDVEPASKLLERILAERRTKWPYKGAYKEPVAPASTNLPPIPTEWCWMTLDQALWQLRSGTAETSRREPTGYPVLKSSAVRHGLIDFADINFLQKSQSQRSDNFLRIGDFLITRLSGSVGYVGCSALVKDTVCDGIQYPDRIFCGKLVPGIDGVYLSYCFQHPHIRKTLGKAAKSTAGHQRISMTDLYPLTLPLPPAAEQEQIIAEVEHRLSVIDELEATVDANLTRAERLRQSILQRAFRGEL